MLSCFVHQGLNEYLADQQVALFGLFTSLSQPSPLGKGSAFELTKIHF
jgi:hypothetical protein